MTPRKASAPSETAISLAIRKALTARGARVIRVNSGGYGRIKGAEPGTPDMVVITAGSAHGYRGGDHFWLEVKTATGKASKEQESWHAWAKANGVSVHVVRSVQEAVDVCFPY